MTISCNGKIQWKGQTYYGADELGFTNGGRFVVSIYNYKEPHEARGNYFTAIPISPDEYRKADPTKAAVRDDGDALTVFCDWGEAHRIQAPRALIEALLAEAAAHGIPVLPNAELRGRGPEGATNG